MEKKKAFMWSADSGGAAQKEISNVCVDFIKKTILSILAVRHESQRVGTPGLAVWSAHLCGSNFYPLRPHLVTWIKTKREGMKSGCFGTLKPGRLGLSSKANKCSNAGTGDLGAQTSQETSTSSSLGFTGSTRPG